MQAAQPKFWPGENGWTQLEYTGKAPGIRPWTGRVTKTVYWFGADRLVGYVDARDGTKFLTPIRTGNAMPVFKVHDENRSKANRERQSKGLG